MALIDGIGYKVVKTLASEPANKNFIRVKQTLDPTVKNYTNVIESTASHKDYINVLVVTHDTPKNYMMVNFANGVCDVYLFKSTDPDNLTLGSPFTGNIRVKIRAPSETGVNPLIVAGRQGTFIVNNDPVNDATHVQYEIEAVALTYIVDDTFNGVVSYAKDGVWYDIDMGAPILRWFYDFDGVASYISCDIDLLIGDTLGFTLLVDSTPSTEYIGIACPLANFSYTFRVNNDGTIGLAGATLEIDGTPASNGSPFPSDGASHHFKLTITGNITIAILNAQMGSGTAIRHNSMNMWDIKKNGGTEVFVAVNDGPTSGGVLVNSGSGGNVTLVNEIIGDWYEE